MYSKIVADEILRNTDWTQIPNSGLTSDCVTEFATYRKSIRVIRQRKDSAESSPKDEKWPEAPKEVWS